jgi:hypothetical protein
MPERLLLTECASDYHNEKRLEECNKGHLARSVKFCPFQLPVEQRPHPLNNISPIVLNNIQLLIQVPHFREISIKFVRAIADGLRD